MLEGESAETLTPQLSFMAERALPDLASNIKCGNSLVEPDFLTHQQLDLRDDEARLRVNVFDWRAEFESAFEAGGFDAVKSGNYIHRVRRPLRGYGPRLCAVIFWPHAGRPKGSQKAVKGMG